MRIFLAIALAASLFVAAGCSCVTGNCPTPPKAAPVCNPCAAPVAPTCSPCGL